MGWRDRQPESSDRPVGKPRRNQPNHQGATAPAATPLECTRCEGTGSLATPAMERDADGHFEGAGTTTCGTCNGTGTVTRR